MTSIDLRSYLYNEIRLQNTTVDIHQHQVDAKLYLALYRIGL